MGLNKTNLVMPWSLRRLVEAATAHAWLQSLPLTSLQGYQTNANYITAYKKDRTIYKGTDPSELYSSPHRQRNTLAENSQVAAGHRLKFFCPCWTPGFSTDQVLRSQGSQSQTYHPGLLSQLAGSML